MIRSGLIRGGSFISLRSKVGGYDPDKIRAQKRESYERRKNLMDLREIDILKASGKSGKNLGPGAIQREMSKGKHAEAEIKMLEQVGVYLEVI